MSKFEVGNERLFFQGVIEANGKDPEEIVARLGAIQGQDYAGALWSVGLRMKNASPALVEQAIADKKIVRTWLLRGTLHFVAARDVRWMLKLLEPRIVRWLSTRHKQLGLDEETLTKSQKIITKALEGGKLFTRPELFRILEDGGVSPRGQRGIHVLSWLSHLSILCHGPYRDKQPTFALLDEYLPATLEKSPEEALAELTRRFFESHGPATLSDFERWVGHKTSDARRGLEAVKHELSREEVGGQTYYLSAKKASFKGEVTGVYLLPGFDEFMLGYKDRKAVLDPEFADRIEPGGNGIFMPTIVSNGRVVGIWKRTINAKKDKITVSCAPFTTLSKGEKEGFEVAAQQYGQFMGAKVVLAEE